MRDKTAFLEGTDWCYAILQIKMLWHMGHKHHQSSDLYQQEEAVWGSELCILKLWWFKCRKKRPVASSFNILDVFYIIYGVEQMANLCLFCPEWEHCGFYQVNSSNWIRLLKLISLVNVWPCAGLKGLIRPGTWRPPPPGSSSRAVRGEHARMEVDGFCVSRGSALETSNSTWPMFDTVLMEGKKKNSVRDGQLLFILLIYFFYFARSQTLNITCSIRIDFAVRVLRSVRFVFLTIIKWFSPLLPDGAWEIVKDPAICVCDQ